MNEEELPQGPEWRIDLIREAAEKLQGDDEVFETVELSEVL